MRRPGGQSRLRYIPLQVNTCNGHMQSRRNFLRALAGSAAVLALEPFAGVSTQGDVYHNERLGLRVRKPPGWEFSSTADFSALRERQVLLDAGPDDPHPLKDQDNLPVFLLEDPMHRQGHFGRAINLYDEPLQEETPDDQASAHAWMLTVFAQSYKDLRVVRAPRLLQLSGTMATLSEWCYLHELDTGESEQLQVQTILVFRSPRVHTFHLGGLRTDAEATTRVWRDFVDSIEYGARRTT